MSEGLTLRMEFRGAELPLVRSLVEEAALRARLAASVKGAFVHAALEVSTNAVVHGGGVGIVELRVMEGELRCEVTDDGAGLPAGGGPCPSGARPGAHGLRLAESLIGPTGRIGVRDTHGGTRPGTTVTLSVPLPAAVCTTTATTPTAR